MESKEKGAGNNLSTPLKSGEPCWDCTGNMGGRSHTAVNFPCCSLLLSIGRRGVFAPDVAGGLVLAHA